MSEMDITKEYYRFFIETMRRNRKSASKIFLYLDSAWGEKAPSDTTVFRTYSELQSGTRTSLSDAARSGRPKTICDRELIDEAEKLVAANPHIPINELARETGISHGSA